MKEKIKNIFWDDYLDMLSHIGFFSLIFGMVFIIIISIFSLSFYSSCRQVKIFNEQNNTTYSCSDMLWASSQINSNTSTIKIK